MFHEAKSPSGETHPVVRVLYYHRRCYPLFFFEGGGRGEAKHRIMIEGGCHEAR